MENLILIHIFEKHWMAKQANVCVMGYQFATFEFTFVTQTVNSHSLSSPPPKGISYFKAVCLNFYMSLLV